MPADSSTNCRRFSTTSNEPWRSGLISERRIRSSSYAASSQGAACTVGDLDQLPFFGRSAASKGLGQTRGPCDRFPVCRVSVGGKPLGMRVPLKFRHAHAFADGEARQSARSSPPWRLSSRSKESAFLSRQWRFCAKYQVNASLGERTRSRFPDEGSSGTAAVSEPPAFTTRNADGCQDSPRRRQSAAGKMPEVRPTHGPPTLGEMCASFTGIKYTFHCAAIKCERSVMFFPRKTPRNMV